MKKLRLDLDDLSVESFSATPDAREEGGTVFGQQCTCYTNCTCPGCPTCDASCNGTCAASCYSCYDPTCYNCYTGYDVNYPCYTLYYDPYGCAG